MPPYGSDDDGFNALSKAYKKDPSIEHYAKLRRENPDVEIEVSIIGGLDTLSFMTPELEKYGFDPLLVADVMDADPAAISEVSLQLMERLIEARMLAKEGGTHLSSTGRVVPDKLVNWLIAVMLDSLSWNDSLHIPRDLIVLIRERVTGANADYRQAAITHHRRQNAILVGAQLMAQGRQPTFRAVGRILNVQASTVMRWFPDGDFLEQVGVMSRWFNEKGELRRVDEIVRPVASDDEPAEV
jgi:hypothetical protein